MKHTGSPFNNSILKYTQNSLAIQSKMIPCCFLLEQKHEIGHQAYLVSGQQLYHLEFLPLLLHSWLSKLLVAHMICFEQQATHLQPQHIQQFQLG